jgi:hypothetical protein
MVSKNEDKVLQRMRNGEVKVTQKWVIRNWKDIEKAIKSPYGFIQLSPKRLIVEKCREDCGYSEHMQRGDIWSSIIRRYNKIIIESALQSEYKPE